MLAQYMPDLELLPRGLKNASAWRYAEGTTGRYPPDPAICAAAMNDRFGSTVPLI